MLEGQGNCKDQKSFPSYLSSCAAQGYLAKLLIHKWEFC